MLIEKQDKFEAESVANGDRLNTGSMREGGIKRDSHVSGVSDWMNIDIIHPDKKQARR